jgi:hypothetical protein
MTPSPSSQSIYFQVRQVPRDKKYHNEACLGELVNDSTRTCTGHNVFWKNGSDRMKEGVKEPAQRGENAFGSSQGRS